MTLFEAIANNDLIAVQTALEQSACVDDRGESSITPLIAALGDEQCSTEIVQLLLEYGADANAVEDDGYGAGASALSFALHGNNLSKVELLLAAGADANYEDSDGDSILCQVMFSGQLPEAERLMPRLELLLAYGAQIQAGSKPDNSPVCLAARIGRFDAVQRLLQAGGDQQQLQWNGLMKAVALGSLEDVRRELALHPDLEAVDCWKRPALHLAVYRGDLDKVRLLHAAGADFNSHGHHYERPLMIAVNNRRWEIFSWFIEQGVEVDALDWGGENALSNAAYEGLADYVAALLQAGADVELCVPSHECEGYTEYLESIDSEFAAMGPAEREEYLAQEIKLPGLRPIEVASTIEVVHLLVNAGANLSDISRSLQAELLGLECEGEIDCTNEDYWKAKSLIEGTANPERMEFCFWNAMIKSGVPACEAREKFEDNSDDEENHDVDEEFDGVGDVPVWSYNRRGRSLTPLPDGRIVEIGGVNDYAYNGDSDQCVYNDVIVHHGGCRFEIYGYPEEVFPYTCHHSATLIRNEIFIIGNSCYDEDRFTGSNPIYRLNCQTYAIEKLETTGDYPGWIGWHRDKLHPDKGENGEIHIQQGQAYEIDENGDGVWRKNEDLFILDLHTLRWRRKQ